MDADTRSSAGHPDEIGGCSAAFAMFWTATPPTLERDFGRPDFWREGCAGKEPSPIFLAINVQSRVLDLLISLAFRVMLGIS